MLFSCFLDAFGVYFLPPLAKSTFSGTVWLFKQPQIAPTSHSKASFGRLQRHKLVSEAKSTSDRSGLKDLRSVLHLFATPSGMQLTTPCGTQLLSTCGGFSKRAAFSGPPAKGRGPRSRPDHRSTR